MMAGVRSEVVADEMAEGVGATEDVSGYSDDSEEFWVMESMVSGPRILRSLVGLEGSAG